MSENGRLELRRREGTGGAAGNPNGYYNDSANNCTFGAGTLAHYGPCSADELARHVDDSQAESELTRRIHAAERHVREHVQNRQLNQNQFDALVSATYNSGNAMNTALNHMNNGDDGAALTDINGLIYVHHHDATGHPVGPAIRSQGLVNRRTGEVQQFNTPVAGQPGGR